MVCPDDENDNIDMPIYNYGDHHREYTYIIDNGNEVKCGYERVYYDSGRLQVIRSWQLIYVDYCNRWDSLEDGECLAFYDNDTNSLQYRGLFSMGRLWGNYIEYYPNGEVKSYEFIEP